MKTVTMIAAVREWRRSIAGSVGLVPTMGSLHEGHLSLVRRARDGNDCVAASLFVNPRQFGAGEDLSRYPRNLSRDQGMLESAGCDLLFAPPVDEMYPPGCEATVDAGAVAMPLEGERRPGHFRSVATVVVKLLGIFTPARAYFGQKDAQQLAVIRRVVRDLDIPVEIVGCPTIRESDGLAMSSRNSYLNEKERRSAPVLYRALVAARQCFAGGEHRATELCRVMQETLAAEPLARVDYVSVADPSTLRELEEVSGPALLSLAVHIGPARLIDNLVVNN
jgi:pantoate--beta-alanine ligase